MSAPFREPTRAELKPGHPIRILVDYQLDAFADDYRTARPTRATLDDWTCRALEGLALPDGSRFSCGPSPKGFPAAALHRIARERHGRRRRASSR